jgi:hypothetical protein
MMTLPPRYQACMAAVILLFTSGCKKTESTPVVPAASTPQPAPVAAAPTATSAATPPAAPEPAASVPVTVDGVTLTTTTGSGKSVEWALKQSEIKNDPAGQWASAATASSAWNDAKDQVRFSPWQATGVPNVDQEGDNPNAWTAKSSDGGIEWLDLTFPKAVAATGLRVRESENPGAIIKLELIDVDSHAHTLWSGTDPTKNLNYLMLTFPKTSYKTNHVKITLATNLIPGDNEIDAVQLVGEDK